MATRGGFLQLCKQFTETQFPKWHHSLPLCLKMAQNIKYDRNEAIRLSKMIKHMSNRHGYNWAGSNLEYAIFMTSLIGNYNVLWDLTANIKQTLKRVQPSVYLLLLQSINLSQQKGMLPCSLNLFNELNRSYPYLSQFDRDTAATHLFESFRTCDDFSLLFLLKTAYENYIHRRVRDKSIELKYVLVYFHVYLNSGQYNRALQLWESSFDRFSEEHDPVEIFRLLPFKELLECMCTNRDFSHMHKWIQKLISLDPTLETIGMLWSKCLLLALDENYFEVVHLLYTKFIMKDQGDISIDDILFSSKMKNLQTNNIPLLSLSDTTIHQILHVLTINGDTSLTESLIQWHHIQKLWKGEKHLTKDLYLQILKAHCHQKSQNFHSILDIIDAIIDSHNITYKDISESISFKLFTLQVKDASVSAAKAQKQLIFNSIQLSASDDDLRPRKVQNPNLYSSEQGNILSKVSILSSFISSNMGYLLKNSSSTTIQLFVNCLLDHITKYQNFSGLAIALMTIAKTIRDENRSLRFLDQDSIDILCHSLSRSTSRFCGLEILTFAKKYDFLMSLENYELLIASANQCEIPDLLDYYLDTCYKEHGVLPAHKSLPDNAPAKPVAYTEHEKVHQLHFLFDQRDANYLRFAFSTYV